MITTLESLVSRPVEAPVACVCYESEVEGKCVASNADAQQYSSGHNFRMPERELPSPNPALGWSPFLKPSPPFNNCFSCA